METCNSNNQLNLLMYLAIISLSLTGLLMPRTVYSDKTMSMENAIISGTPVDYLETQDPERNTPLSQKSPHRKTVLIDDNKGLSGFFKLGIAINILMVVSFFWWFLKEWRKSKK